MADRTEDAFEALLAAWHARGDSEKLYRELRRPMRQAARRGIRRITQRPPDGGDVDDVVLKAFKEVLAADPAAIRSVVGFARTVAERRGMDRGREINRDRNRIWQHAWELNELSVSQEDESAGAERERLLRRAEECMGELPESQRDVIERTVMQHQSLSDWTTARGTSYEAGRRMRIRGLQALRRCIARRLDSDLEGES